MSTIDQRMPDTMDTNKLTCIICYILHIIRDKVYDESRAEK